MKKLNILSAILVLTIFSSCAAVEGIFKAGMGVGIFLTIAIIVIIVAIVMRAGKK